MIELKAVPGLSNVLSIIRRELHSHPEIGFQEHRTSAYIREQLESFGLEPKGPLAGTGLYVDIEGVSHGPIVAYRADIDALPVADEKMVPYASKNPGFGHMCGHDAHTAIAIGIAATLNINRSAFSGQVRVFFQPNEEGVPSGAPVMIREGVLDGIDAIFASHVDSSISVGKFGLIKSYITAGSDRFKITIKGEGGGHAARPHQSIDTVWIASQIMNALYQVSGRLTDVRNPLVLTVTRVHGGTAYNVIPEQVEIGGTLRSTDQGNRERAIEYIRKIAESTGQLFGATVEVETEEGSAAVFNDAALVDLVENVATRLFGRESIFHIPLPSMGSEDFGYYTRIIPGALIRIGTSSSVETSYSLHNSRFDIDETAMAGAVKLMAGVMVEYLERVQ